MKRFLPTLFALAFCRAVRHDILDFSARVLATFPCGNLRFGAFPFEILLGLGSGALGRRHAAVAGRNGLRQTGDAHHSGHLVTTFELNPVFVTFDGNRVF